MTLLLLALLGCSRTTVPGDSAAPDTTPGVDPTVPAAVGEARAGVIPAGSDGEAALFGGITAEGQAGDIKLYNHRVQVVIQAPVRSHGYIDTGGHIIDLDVVRDDGSLGRDTVEDHVLAFDMARLFHADSIEIVADGSEGGSAIVRVHGTDVPWGFFQGLFEYDSPTVGDLGLDITTEYQLAPDSDSLTIVSTIQNGSGVTAAFTPQEGFFVSGEDLLPWTPGQGYDGPDVGVLPAASFVGRQGEAAFSVWTDDAEGLSISILSSLTAELGIFLADHPRVELAPGDQVELVRHLSIGRDIATVEAARQDGQGAALGTVQGAVTAAGAALPGVRVHVVDDQERVVAVARSDADGAWQADLPAGDYTAWFVALPDDEIVELPAGSGRYGPYTAASVNDAQLAAIDGRTPATPLPHAQGHAVPQGLDFTVSTGGTATLDADLAPASSIRVTVVDDQDRALPAVLDLRWQAGSPPASLVPDTLKGPLDIPTSGRAAWVWTHSGTVEIPALPGTYTITAGHSWRHERADPVKVVVEEGEQTPVEIVLAEVVPRGGWQSLDSHLHGSPSFDGALPMEHRLVTCAATGVDLPVMTDHDSLADYRDLATALGLDGRMRVFPGFELTTLVRGHFNIFPVEPQQAPNGGAIRWWEQQESTPELFTRMRAMAGEDALIQVNHPRTPGMNAFAGYDDETATPSSPDFWSWEFDTFELFNGGVDDLDEMREDWFSYLDFGRIRLPVGVSDSHYRFIPCGVGHTDLFVGSDDPADIDEAALLAALRAGHVIVASGTTLRVAATVDGVEGLPGDTLVGNRATVQVRVSSPDWVQPGTLRIWQDGEVVAEQVLDSQQPDGVWLDDAFELTASDDAWIAVEVVGTATQGDLWRNIAPYAMSNAIFLDVDGDGWTARYDFD